MRTPTHFVNLTGESKNFKMVIFLSQTESTPKFFLEKKSTGCWGGQMKNSKIGGAFSMYG
jgi:hypothetical protein